MNPRRILILTLVVGVCSITVSVQAQAQTQTDIPDCASNPACKLIFLQGREQSDQNNPIEALRLYKAAYEVRADPLILFSIARVLHKQGKALDAMAYYRHFIDSPLDKPELKAKAKEYLTLLESFTPPPPLPPPPPPPPPPLLSGASVLPPSQAPMSRQQAVPVYRKWWFWTILGTIATAGIAAGIAGGVIASQPSIPEPSFRPF